MTRRPQRSTHAKTLFPLHDALPILSIFSDEGSFAYKNIVKTEQDYNRIMEVTISDINDYAVDAFLEYDVIYIFGFIIMMFTVLSFLDERKRGLWQIVHTCRNGRLKIVLNRLFILAWVAVITEIILVTSTLFVSFLDYGGADILFDSVQSVGKLQDFVLPVTLFEFLMYYILFLSGKMSEQEIKEANTQTFVFLASKFKIQIGRAHV